jgi:catechol 2,3-dioxygenase-like lactoylglutathione lyase family enzyme
MLGGSSRKGAGMLGDKSVAVTLAVSDLERARDFYENTLGLQPVQEIPGAVLYRSGSSVVLVYPSEYAGTNQATAASWAVGDDFDAIVEDLRAKGVTFEHYDDLPETTRDGDVHTMGDMKGVWFKDPDGNILSVADMPAEL